jgi:hypothetical protein
MSDSMEAVLRNSLDAIDRGRRWAMVGLAALFVATAIALAALMAIAAHTGPASPDALMLKALYVSSAAEMLLVACCTALVMFHVTRTARAILRSVELTGKRDRS